MSAISDEIGAVVTGKSHSFPGHGRHIINSLQDAYALASRFKNVLYKYPFFKKKHLRILRSIIDRCGEAYHEKDLSILYISRDTIDEWIIVFHIPPEKIMDYLRPLLIFNILERSDRSGYEYRISDKFFQLMGPVAQYLVVPVDTRRFTSMMAIASGLSSIHVIATAIKSKKFLKGKPLIPWFLKLPMIYTLAGLEPNTTRIDDVLRLPRVNAVDNYFVIERKAPVELWRSIRTEAFEFMADNQIIEQAIPDGYRLVRLWVRMHEEGVRRYIMRLRERYEHILR